MTKFIFVHTPLDYFLNLTERNKKIFALFILLKVFTLELTGPCFLVILSVKILFLTNIIRRCHVFKGIFQKNIQNEKKLVCKKCFFEGKNCRWLLWRTQHHHFIFPFEGYQERIIRFCGENITYW